jgi:hypothetical protein
VDLHACRKSAVIERTTAPLFSPHCRLRFMDEAMAHISLDVEAARRSSRSFALASLFGVLLRSCRANSF